MRCANCSKGNSDLAVNCEGCDTPLPGRGFSLAINLADTLIREHKVDEAAQQLIKCEAELGTARLSPLQRDLANARLLVAKGRLYFGKGLFSLAEDSARRALTLINVEDGDDTLRLKAAAYGTLSSIATYRNDYAVARQYNETARQAAQIVNDDFFLSGLMNNRGNIERATGNSTVAIHYYSESLKYAQATGATALASIAASNLAFLYEQQGNYAQSLSLAEQALTLGEQAGSKQRVAAALQAIGAAAGRLGDYAQAEQSMQRALQLVEGGEVRNAAVQIYTNLAEFAWLKQDYATMRTLAQKAISNSEGDYRDNVVLHAMMVHAALQMYNLDDARRALERMNKEREQRNAPEFRDNYYFVLVAAPLLLVARGDWPAAVEAFEQAIIRADEHDDQYTSGQVRLIYAEAGLDRADADHQRIADLLREAHSIFSKLGAVREANKTAALMDSTAKNK